MRLISKIKNTVKKRLQKYIYNEIFPNYFNVLNLNFDYLRNKKENKKVVYTCLTGDYDILHLQEYIDYSYDYVCFTDNKQLLQSKNYGVWEIKPLYFSKLNNQLNNRWHKTHPHVLFPEYDSSIYIDSNVIFLDNHFYKQIEEKNNNICIPIHTLNDCIYKEVKYAIKQKKITVRETENIINLLKNDNFPEHYGLNENNLIYRKHNDLQIINMMEEWWKLISTYCKRDQLSLAYILWKNNIKPKEIAIDNTHDYARVLSHNI